MITASRRPGIRFSSGLITACAVATSCGRHRAVSPPEGQPVAAPAPGLAPAPGPAAALPPRVVRANGTELHYVEKGSGLPVVFVHGSLGTLDDWRTQLDAFASQYRVIAYSRRYHPPNPAQRDGQSYALSLHADDLAALLERLGISRAHIVGSSYGAYAALLLALRRPELVRTLVLEDPPILPWLARTPEGDSIRRAFEATVITPARAAFARGDSVGGLRRFLDGVSGTPGRFDRIPEASRRGVLRLAFELRLELLADPAAYLPPLSCKDVARIRSPVLLLTGERSPRMFHVITEELERCLLTEELVTVPGAGYDSHAASPRFYDETVLRFLAKN